MQSDIARAVKTRGLIAAGIVSLAVAWGHSADAAARVAWATGEAFRQQLTQPVNILWSGDPLRRAIQGLSESQRVAILIDRRVDPDQKLNLALKDVPLESALQTIADGRGLGISQLGSVVYFGPASAAERLRPMATAFQQAVRQLPAAAQRKFLLPKGIAWQELSTPRELLAQLGQQNSVEIMGLEQVPHDLWAAVDLPPLSLVDRLTLIAAQFDLTIQVAAGGTRLTLVPVPESLRGSPEDRRPSAAMRRPSPPTSAEPPTSLATLRIRRMSVQAEPLGPVLRQLADRLGLELRIDEKALAAAGISLDQRVSVTVENATVDELLRRLLKSTGLTFHRRQKLVEIVPAK